MRRITLYRTSFATLVGDPEEIGEVVNPQIGDFFVNTGRMAIAHEALKQCGLKIDQKYYNRHKEGPIVKLAS